MRSSQTAFSSLSPSLARASSIIFAAAGSPRSTAARASRNTVSYKDGGAAAVALRVSASSSGAKVVLPVFPDRHSIRSTVSAGYTAAAIVDRIRLRGQVVAGRQKIGVRRAHGPALVGRLGRAPERLEIETDQVHALAILFDDDVAEAGVAERPNVDAVRRGVRVARKRDERTGQGRRGVAQSLLRLEDPLRRRLE